MPQLSEVIHKVSESHCWFSLSSVSEDHTRCFSLTLHTIWCSVGGKSWDATMHDKIIISCCAKWISSLSLTSPSCLTQSFSFNGDYSTQTCLQLLHEEWPSEPRRHFCWLPLFIWRMYRRIWICTVCNPFKFERNASQPFCLVTSCDKHAVSGWGSLSRFRCLWDVSSSSKTTFPSWPFT